MLLGDLGEARRLYEESLPLWREIGHRSGLVDSLRGLGNVARLEGGSEEAASYLEENLAVSRDIGTPRGSRGGVTWPRRARGGSGELEEASAPPSGDARPLA